MSDYFQTNNHFPIKKLYSKRDKLSQWSEMLHLRNKTKWNHL